MSNKIPSIVLAVLMIITLIVCGFFYIGGEEAYATTAGEVDAPSYTSMLINWAYVLVLIASIATVVFALYTFILKATYNGKSVIVPLITFAALALLLLITYLCADTTPLNIVGYEGSQEPWVYRLTNMCIASSVILAAIATFVTIFGFLGKKIS